jgi:hypothetical protein
MRDKISRGCGASGKRIVTTCRNEWLTLISLLTNC